MQKIVITVLIRKETKMRLLLEQCRKFNVKEWTIFIAWMNLKIFKIITSCVLCMQGSF